MFCENERESIKFGKDLLIGVEYKRYSPDPCADPYPAYPLPHNFREIDTRWEAGGRGGALPEKFASVGLEKTRMICNYGRTTAARLC